jgi:hypothetical protein
MTANPIVSKETQPRERKHASRSRIQRAELRSLLLQSSPSDAQDVSLDHHPVVLLAQPERDDRDMYAEYLRAAGFVAIPVSSAADALPPHPRHRADDVRMDFRQGTVRVRGLRCVLDEAVRPRRARSSHPARAGASSRAEAVSGGRAAAAFISRPPFFVSGDHRIDRRRLW